MVSLATTICRDQDQLFYKIHCTDSAEQIDSMSAPQSGYNSLTSPVSACTKASMRANPSKPKAFATISILFLHDVIAASLICPPNNQDNVSILHLLVGCKGRHQREWVGEKPDKSYLTSDEGGGVKFTPVPPASAVQQSQQSYHHLGKTLAQVRNFITTLRP